MSFNISAPKGPVIKKAYQSGLYLPNNNPKRTSELVNHHFPGSLFSTIMPTTSNTIYPFSNVDLDGLDFKANNMINSDQFNVIKVDLNTHECVNPTRINIHYCQSDVLTDSNVKYSTIIAPNTNFYRNYPVENKYFNISFENMLTVDPTSNGTVNGNITLSRFTEFNPPIQTEDLTDRFMMNNATRITNSFDDDISLENRITDVTRFTRMGITNNINALEQLNWDEGSNFDFGNTTFTTVNIVSSDAGDAGKEVAIRGLRSTGEVAEEVLVLGGTSNSTTSVRSYNCIDDIKVLSANNLGNLKVKRATNAELMCYSQTQSGRSTTLSYICTDKGKSIIKTLSLLGHIGLTHATKFSLYKINSFGERKMLFNSNIENGPIDNSYELNEILQPSERVYGELISGSTVSVGDDTKMTSRLDILEYSTNPDNVIL